LLEQRRTAVPADSLRFSPYNTEDVTMPRLGAFILASATVMLAQSVQSAEVLLSCVWQSLGTGHAKRAFEIIIDQQMQRAELSGNESLPATISDTQITFAVNRSGSIFQYAIDRPSGFGTITMKDQVLYSGSCKIGDAAHRTF
jgi:hypothetical protein